MDVRLELARIQPTQLDIVFWQHLLAKAGVKVKGRVEVVLQQCRRNHATSSRLVLCQPQLPMMMLPLLLLTMMMRTWCCLGGCSGLIG